MPKSASEGGFTMLGIAGTTGNAPEQKQSNALNPGPLKPSDPDCCPVSKKTPTPPRTTVSRSGALWRTYANPRRGAKLYHVVFHSGAPCGPSVQLSGLDP